VINEVPWFSNLIRALCSDYNAYNKVLQILISLSSNPLKSSINDVFVEEKRLSRKIIRQEQIIRGWLRDAPVLEEKAAVSLDDLSRFRKESAALRIKGCATLRTGMALLEQERGRVKGNSLLKSTKKEAVPRLIDIHL